MIVRETADQKAEPLSAERLVHTLRLSDPAPSPDGDRVAFCVAAGFSAPGRGPERALWLVDGDGDAAPVAAGPGADALPRWSPDGTTLAFASSRDHPGRMSVQLLDVSSGEARAVGEIGGSVEEIVWSRDGERLLVMAVDADPAEAEAGPRVFRPSEPAEPWRRLYLVETARGETTEVGPEGLTVWEVDWDGGDAAVALLASDPTENGWYRAFVGTVDLATGVATTVHTPAWQVANPRISPAGASIAFLEGICSDQGGLVGTVTIVDRATGEVRMLAPELDVSSLEWRDESRLWFTARRAMEGTCGSLSLDGTIEQLWRGEGAFGPYPRLRADRDGQRLVAMRESLYEPPEVATLELDRPDAGWRPLTALNAALAGAALPRAEKLAWSAPDGLEIEGLLVHPRNEPAAPPPLVVFVHGGPTATWSYAFPCGFRHAALLAEAGYAVLLPNPRGSTGRGQEFARAVIGDLGGAELQDLLSGVDACVEAGICDGERVGIIGASHGGFIAAWAVTQTQRFGASVALACVSDYVSAHFASTIPTLDDILFAEPESPATAYLERSPVAHARSCVTPTLILHGEIDPYCPVGQAHELYGALVEAGVETELVVYPREGHGWNELEHQLDLWRRIRDWFDRHLAAR